MSQIQVRDSHGQGIPLMNIRVAQGAQSSDEALFDVFTDLAGNTGWPIPFFPNGPYTLYVNYANVIDGYGTAQVSAVVPSGDIVVTMNGADAGGEHGFLHTDNSRVISIFKDEQDRLWPFIGYSAHLLMTKIKKGEDVGPFIEQARGFGYNTLITIGTHLSPWKQEHGFFLDPLEQGYQNLLAVTFELAAEHGLRVAHAVLADCQYGLPASEQRYVWDLSCEVMKGRWNVFARLGNEWSVNGWYPGDFSFPDLGGVLASTGSGGENGIPFQAYRDFVEWEPRRGPYHKAMDDCGAGIIELYNGYNANGQQVGPFRCPVVAIEPAYFHETDHDQWGDARETDPALALQMGLEMGPNSAGGGFGCSNGLEGELAGPIASECARQLARGMRTSFLR